MRLNYEKRPLQLREATAVAPYTPILRFPTAAIWGACASHSHMPCFPTLFPSLSKFGTLAAKVGRSTKVAR